MVGEKEFAWKQIGFFVQIFPCIPVGAKGPVCRQPIFEMTGFNFLYTSSSLRESLIVAFTESI